MVKITRLIKSFTYAFRGLSKTFREEQNLRIHTLVALLAIGLSAYLKISALEWVAILFAITLVMLMELVNSAVERVTDVLKPRINSYVKEIKDIVAAAVMFASIAAIVVGAIIFLPHLIEIFGKQTIF